MVQGFITTIVIILIVVVIIIAIFVIIISNFLLGRGPRASCWEVLWGTLLPCGVPGFKGVGFAGFLDHGLRVLVLLSWGSENSGEAAVELLTIPSLVWCMGRQSADAVPFEPPWLRPVWRRTCEERAGHFLRVLSFLLPASLHVWGCARLQVF